MFCSKCGRKVSAGATKCPKCGAEPFPADYCGGFWMLTESGGTAAEPRAHAEAPDAFQQEQLAKMKHMLTLAKKRERTLLITIIALSAVLLIAAIALILSLTSRRDEPAPQEPSAPVVSTEPAKDDKTATEDEKEDKTGEDDKSEDEDESEKPENNKDDRDDKDTKTDSEDDKTGNTITEQPKDNGSDAEKPGSGSGDGGSGNGSVKPKR